MVNVESLKEEKEKERRSEGVFSGRVKTEKELGGEVIICL